MEDICSKENSSRRENWLQMQQKEPNLYNALKLKKAKNELANIYLKEQTEYIKNQIKKIFSWR